MRRVLLPALAALAACSSLPEEEEGVLGVFEYISRLKVQWVDNHGRQSEEGLLHATFELKRVAGLNFDRILRQAGGPDLERRKLALFALGFSSRPDAIPALVENAGHADLEVRYFAVAGLGMLGLHQVPTEPFRKALEDRSASVRHAAVFGLRFLLSEENDRGLLEAVHQRLTDASVDVRIETLILLRHAGRKESVEPILRTSALHPDPHVRSSAAVTLGALGKEAASALPQLVEMLRDTDPKVVESVHAALHKITSQDLDRSYHSWRDWFEDEQRHQYVCTEHPDAARPSPGECVRCKKKLERFAKESPRKGDGSTVYACPDHPEVRTTTVSQCGKTGCGRALVPVKPAPAVYACPDHPEIVTSTPASCGKPGCGKTLVPKPQ